MSVSAPRFDNNDFDNWVATLTRKIIDKPSGDLWVFGYGSLIWNPGFKYRQALAARIYGLHRALCVWSWRYRGTPENPGLVLGLDHGGSCIGRAFLVSRRRIDETLEYLRDRELFTGIYDPVYRAAYLKDGRQAEVLTFVVDKRHRQYAGRLNPVNAAETIRGATGEKGCNRSYVVNTVDHLQALGFNDHSLQQVCQHL